MIQLCYSNMVLALKELSIRGDFRTTVEYLTGLLETPDFVDNDFDTAWLDELIAGRMKVIHSIYSIDTQKYNNCRLKSRQYFLGLCARRCSLLKHKLSMHFRISKIASSGNIVLCRNLNI